MHSKNIRARLAYHGLTLDDLSKVINISKNTVSQKMQGKTGWWLSEAALITNYFRELGDDCTLEELFGIK